MIKAFLRSLLKPFSFVPALLMMYLIFSFSAQDGTTSGNLSYMVSEIIVETANDAFDLHWSSSEIKQHIKEIHHPVRKLAHMTEYFLLAISVSFPLYVYGVRGIWLPLLAGMICVGFAALDEYHQSFVAGRRPFQKGCGNRQHRRVCRNYYDAVYLLSGKNHGVPSTCEKKESMMQKALRYRPAALFQRN